MTINYKDDFDFIIHLHDAAGAEIPFPDFDFTVLLYTNSRSHVFKAQCIKGKCKNCYNDNGKIHIVCNNHHLGPGILHAEFISELPVGLYPDSHRRHILPSPLDIVLIATAAPPPAKIDVETLLPYIYTSAYTLAKSAGFKGSEKEYADYLNRLPQIVAASESLNALMADWADGKRVLSDALRKWKSDSEPSDSFVKMADDILRLPVAPEPYSPHEPYDLMEVLRNNMRMDYPYVCGALFGKNENSDKVILSGADAYLTSDGSFYEGDAEHTFNDGEEDTQRWIIYYFDSPDFTVPVNLAVNYARIVVLNGRPKFVMADTSLYIGSVESYVEEPYDLTNAGELNINNPRLSTLLLKGLRSCVGGVVNCTNCGEISLPDLEVFNFTTFVHTYAAKGPYLPKLKEVTGGTVWLNKTFSKYDFKSIEQISNKSTLLNNCVNLSELTFPNLRAVNTSANTSNGVICQCRVKVFNFPKLKILDPGVYSLVNRNSFTDSRVIINLPSLEECRNSQSNIVVDGSYHEDGEI